MGWFKKLTGVSTKDALGAVATIGATYLTGSPQVGAATGSMVSGGQGGILQNILGGAVGLGSDYLQAQINLAQQKDLAKYNAAQQTLLNQQAFDNNVKMWNMQNEYNTPTEQMKRLQAAGMNLNLVYGGGNVTGNTAGSAPQIEPAKFDTGAFHPVDTRIERAQLALAMASQYQQVENQKIHNDLMRQRLALAERSADRADAALMLRNARVNTALTNEIESDKDVKERQKLYDREYSENMATWRNRELIHRKETNYIMQKVYKAFGDPWYRQNPQPQRFKAQKAKLHAFGHRV